ncbi:MAG: metallophosphoesterase [Oscillospiraceae bacterium]|nr:metallophosphoesterase [Oscillospiraceae bacterium]
MGSRASDKRISAAHSRAKTIEIDDASKIVLFSDLHRGTGTGADDFARNEKLYYAALCHYYREGYTYIELGDGDELWQERHMWEITAAHDHIFELLARFYRAGRLHMLYGNHDKVKRDPAWSGVNLRAYTPRAATNPVPLFPDIAVEEAIILEYQPTGGRMLLLHGHQADFFNYRLWWLGRFLTRYIWRPLELVGFRNPFDTEQNHKRKNLVEERLTHWGETQAMPIVAGHTHRPVFPAKCGERYLNTGSGVHTRYITALEFAEGVLAPIKWEVDVNEASMLCVVKEALAEPRRIASVF